MARTNKYTSLNFNHIFDKTTPSTTSTTTSTTSRFPSSTTLPHKSYSLSASSHGGMLLLSRPKPQPQPLPPPQPQPPQQPPLPPPQLQPFDFPAITSPQLSKPIDSDSTISLRPQGKTGGSGTHERDTNITTTTKVDIPIPSPKGNKFVPPHLRPGFVPREPPSVPEFQKPRQGNYHRPGSAHGNYNGRPKSGGGYRRPGSAHGGYYGSSNWYGDEGRPKSGGGGGGYDRRMRGGGHGGPPHVGVEYESGLMNRPRSGGNRPNSSG